MSDYTGDVYPSDSDYSLWNPDGEPDYGPPSTSPPQQGNGTVPQVQTVGASQAPRDSPEGASSHLPGAGQSAHAATASTNREQIAAVVDAEVINSRSNDEESDDDDSQLTPMPRKRKYRYQKRTPASPKSPSRQKKWLEQLESMSEQKLRRTKCCKNLKCFSHIKYDYFMEKARQLLSVSSFTRRVILCSFVGSDGVFKFDGRCVCAIFIKKSFHFSSVLIAKVSREYKPIAGSLEGCSNSDGYLQQGDSSEPELSTPRTLQSISSTKTSQASDEASNANLVKKEAIVSFLQRLAEDCGDSMPDRTEVHLPFHQRRELYPLFVSEFQRLYPTLDPATPQYFRRCWKEHCHQFKVMAAQRFSTCDECDRLRTGLRNALLSGKRTDLLKQQRKDHLEFIFAERMEYQRKKDRARLQTTDCCSIIIDGADQSAFGIPHFTTKPKAQRGHAMKVKLIGLLEHKIENRLTMFTMTEEHGTGANHIVEVLHRFVNVKREEGPLPAKFYVQLDNCSRENKNKYVMAYFDMLVAVGAFESVEVGFLPVGHTHEDVDQCFSQTSARLRVHNAITLGDLHHELRQSNKGGCEVQHMKRLANFSGLCDQENCVKRIDRITQWRYFLFTRDPSRSHDLKSAPLTTKCFVKKKSTDAWQTMFKTEVGPNPYGILRRCPDIKKTPPLTIMCPDGISNVTKRFNSEEGRINDPEKLISLHELRDFVFSSREDPFHWNIQGSIEAKKSGPFSSGNDPENGEEDVSQENEVTPQQISSDEPNVTEEMSSIASSHVANGDDIEIQTEVRAEKSGSSTARSGKCNNDSKQPEPTSKVNYAVGSFVVVQHKSEGSASDGSVNSIWVAQVLEVHKRHNTNFVETLKVHWYDSVDVEINDIVQSKFHPCYQPLPAKKSRKVQSRSLSLKQKQDQKWCDTIHTDTVLVSFPNLTKRGNLPLSVQNKICR